MPYKGDADTNNKQSLSEGPPPWLGFQEVACVGFVDRKVSANEAIGLPILVATHLPVCIFAPAFFNALVVYAVAFGILHNYQHRRPEFTKKYFPWHWNHHMGNPNKSWGVVLPIMDWLTGTLEKPLDSQQ